MDETCCNKVCACDAFCCEVAWDDNCAGTGVGNSGCGAEALCGSLCVEPCPDGPVTFVDPPDGVIDARQPHRPASGGNRQGIDTITVEAPPGADNQDCWTVCETVVEGSPNEIATIADNGDGAFTLTLDRPLSAGGLTTITYTADGGAVYTGTYVSHPANIDGDAQADTDDLGTFINCCLNQQCDPGPTPAETPYRCDIDHSGGITPADMLRAIDLLNGADQFETWLDTPLPTSGGICPSG
jgi:hypothetical protein